MSFSVRTVFNFPVLNKGCKLSLDIMWDSLEKTLFFWCSLIFQGWPLFLIAQSWKHDKYATSSVILVRISQLLFTLFSTACFSFSALPAQLSNILKINLLSILMKTLLLEKYICGLGAGGYMFFYS